MEKLLHKQLRDVDKLGCSAVMLSGLTGLEATCDTQCTKCISKQYDALADRIEREYIPRPRYEDGLPVQFGDDIEHPDTGDKCVIQSIHIFDGGNYCFALQGTAVSAHYMKDEFVKRPAPKVLDADGVEIKVGDTVWSTLEYEHEPLKVKELVEGNKFKAEKKPDEFYFIASSFTHERPVFDANDERICKGDTVWDLDSGERLHVEEFANRECGLVQCSNEEDGYCEDYDAHKLTHREPDNLEKLRDRMTAKWSRAWAENEPITEKELHGFIDDITALIERGA